MSHLLGKTQREHSHRHKGILCKQTKEGGSSLLLSPGGHPALSSYPLSCSLCSAVACAMQGQLSTGITEQGRQGP